MLQLQYYNSKLTKSQIDGILNNFNIKYTTVKNEIDSKLNNLLKLFMDDILSFLENIEEISKERKKLKDFENFKREYDILSMKLKEKTLNEHKLESDIESLQKEIVYLKNENKSNKKKIISETKVPTTAKSKTTKNIFSNKKHTKFKSESINTTLDILNNTSNISNINNKNNNNGNNIMNTAKKINKAKTKIIIPNKNIERTAKKKTRKENGPKEKKYLSPDLITLNKNKIIDNSNKIDKTIQKIKQYNMNRNNIRIKRMQNFKLAKNKNKFKTKIKTDNLGQKKNSRNYNTKEKEDDLEKKETFEPDKFLSLAESIPINDDINLNNYSEDDDNQSKNNSSCSISEEVDSENIESVDDEIKELEEDENNILMIMKQIKELSLNPMAI